MLNQLVENFISFMNAPKKVFYFCLCIIFYNLFISGTIVKICRLNADYAKIEKQHNLVEKQNKELALKIKQAKDSDFIERQALDRFDMVSANDLVFYFPE